MSMPRPTTTTAHEPVCDRTQPRWGQRNAPGILFSLAVAIAAWCLGKAVPVIGAPVFAIAIGTLIRSYVGLHPRMTDGVSFGAKKLLQAAIVLLGGGLSIQSVLHTGIATCVVMLGTLMIALVGGEWIGRAMRLPANLVHLITVGTAVCGASAISSVAPLIEASEFEVAYSIATIFLFNIIAVFIFPFIGHALGLSNSSFGLWAGTAINDTSSVVAAGFVFSAAAGQIATVVKLARSIMIVPICFLFAFRRGQKSGGHRTRPVNLPWFILLFLIMSVIQSLGWFGPHGGRLVGSVGQFLVIVALAAIGLSNNLRDLRSIGFRPVVMGLATWVLVACSSLLLQRLTGH